MALLDPSDAAPAPVGWSLCGDAAEVLERTAGCAAVGVDVPIGLPDSGDRACDRAARDRLGAARSSVFPAPVRAVLGAADHRGASEISAAVHGKRISVQAWGLVPKIAQWDAQPWSEGHLAQRIVEVHPEVSFRAMAPEVAFAGKKSARGAVQRLAALARWRAGLTDGLPDDAPLDDALDALACAWSAVRWARGRAEVLGNGERDGAGRPMRIVV